MLIRERWNHHHGSDKARSSIIDVLQTQPDVEVVGEVSEHVELLVAVRETKADAILLVINPEEDEGMLSHLFAEYPDLTVLAVTAGHADGNSSVNDSIFIEQRCRYRSSVSDNSPKGIVQALCHAVREPYELINLGNRQH